MKIPTSLYILGKKWRIKKTKKPIIFDGCEMAGLMDPDSRTITICTIERDVPQIFLHELNHAVLSELGLHLTKLDANLEELIVDNLAKVYVDLFDIKMK